MKLKIIYLTISLSICPIMIWGQIMYFGIQANKYCYIIPQYVNYERNYYAKPNLDFNMSFNYRRLIANINVGRQVNTLLERNLEDHPSVWTIENEKKIRTQKYLELSIGGMIYVKNGIEVSYISGLRVNKSVKTYYWREAVNKSTKEFTFYDSEMKVNSCVRQSILVSYKIVKSIHVYGELGLLHNVKPYDELDEQNVIKNDFRVAYFGGLGLKYSVSLGKNIASD